MAWRIGCGLLCLAAGCGPVGVGGTTTNSPTQDDITTEVFPDDADPVMAAQPFVANELLVQPYPGADTAALQSLYQQAGARVIGALEDVGLAVLEVENGGLEATAAQLAQSAWIEGIHKNYILQAQEIPDDADLGRQTHLVQVNAAGAWNLTIGDPSISVAVVDTGVRADHPDLAERVTGGWNVYNNSADFSDPVGHGTLVAGVLAASTNNGIGVAGVTWSNPLLVVRAANRAGEATSRSVAAGILWAASRGAGVVNVSFAPLWSNAVVRSAARQAFHRGSLVVISAGNGGGDTSARGFAEAIFVGAVDEADAAAFFSDRGPFVDLVAPGTAIRSTTANGGYQPVTGTSFAAPIVAGVVALARSMNPQLRPITIIDALAETATDLGQAGRDRTYGHGRVDAFRAVEAVAERAFLPDETPPSLSVTQPQSGATISRRFVARATATDPWGVADVVMRIDGQPMATDTRAPFRFLVEPANFSAGRHTLSFVATDLSGNPSDTVSVEVEFSQGRLGGSRASGSVVFTGPSAGAEVSGDVLISAEVTAKAGLTTLEWSVDGVSMNTTALSGESTDVNFLWRASQSPQGWHTIGLTVTDSRGDLISGTLRLRTP